jgi:hypothetical protein
LAGVLATALVVAATEAIGQSIRTAALGLFKSDGPGGEWGRLGVDNDGAGNAVVGAQGVPHHVNRGSEAGWQRFRPPS